MGGGLNIPSAADIRIATPDARFASPLGRTIGNRLPMSSCARIAGAIGRTAKSMLATRRGDPGAGNMSRGVL